MQPISFKFKGGQASGSGAAGGGGGLYAGTAVEGVDSATSAPSTSQQGPDASASAGASSGPSSSSNWSAALGFAPVAGRRKGAAAKSKASSASSQNATIAIAAAAQPVLYTNNSSSSSTTMQEGPSGSSSLAFKPTPAPTLSKFPPPPTTLQDEDINGFRKTEAGQKATAARNKKNKKKGRQQQQDPSRDWLADYDPAKPNDYTEYKAHVSRKKAQKEQALKEQEIQHSIQAAAALAGSRGEEEYDDEDEDDDDGAESDDSEERDRAFKARAAQFAPPKSYEAESIAPPPLAPPADVPPPPPAPQQPIQQAESGDEAYARRLALSQQAQQQSGEDAYARRLAMSQQHQQQPHEPSLRPTPAPAGDVVQQPDAPAPQASSHEDKIAQAQARARAITEKFGKLNAAAASTPAAAAAATQAPAQATSSSDPLSVQPMPPKRPREEDAAEDEGRRPNPQAFAERLMSKYGWKKGQGLGAAEDGVTKALRVKETPVDKPAGGSSSSSQTNAEGSSGGPVGRRGVIVSERRDAKDKSEKERFGEPSRFVCLTNMVARSEVDDELPSEIADEAQKHGIVQRCFVHIMPLTAPVEEEVRIIVVFSGMVGAWKAVKEFDGRLFNGRHVRARFFPEVWAERAIWGMSLD